MQQANSDRTWPLPNRSHTMRMGWHDLLFAHWAFKPAKIQSLLPDGVEVDTYHGQAWIAVVPFHMTDVAPRGVPAIPWMSAFPELNVRTYVTLDGKPGVWFFSLDATNRVAVRVARYGFHLAYKDAKMSIAENDGWYEYTSQRLTRTSEPAANFVGRYRATGNEFHAKPGSLEHWLTARYCLYTADRKGTILRGEIDHPPWTLQCAELEIGENTMLSWLGLESEKAPHLLFSKDIHVKAWSNRRVVT